MQGISDIPCNWESAGDVDIGDVVALGIYPFQQRI